MFTAIAAIAGPLIGASMQSDAAQGAANTQAGATDRASAISDRQFQQTRSDQAPFRVAGTSAIDRLKALLGMGAPPASGANSDEINRQLGVIQSLQQQKTSGTDAYGNYAPIFDQNISAARAAITAAGGDPDAQAAAPAANVTPEDFGSLNKKFSVSDFWNDPVVQLGYQSGLDLGTKALKNAAPLTTGLDSGAAMKELTKFGTDYTGMKAGDSQQRFIGDQNNTINRIMALVNGGQVATQATGAAGTANATNQGNLITSQGNAQGAAQIAGANAWGGGLSSISNFWQQQNLLNKLTKTGGGFGGGTSSFQPSFTES